MKLLDAKTSADLVKLLVFIVVTTLATSLLVVMVGNLTFGASKAYKAEFVDATGVVKGDDVRVAGVKVGSVTDIEIVDRSRALVSFDVDSDVEVNLATHAAIRYRNLVGQRYISLSQQVGDTTPLEAPTRSSRSSRARAARWRACWATPPRSPRPWPTATTSSAT